MSDLKIESNYGQTWRDSVDSYGDISDAPIYLVNGSSTYGAALELEDIDRLIEARDALLKAQAEVKAEIEARENALPTTPGLYVHPRFVQAQDMANSEPMILRLDGQGRWTEITTGSGEELPVEQVQRYRRAWHGLARLQVVTD